MKYFKGSLLADASPSAMICAAAAAFSWRLIMIRGGLQHNELMLQNSTLKKIFQIIVPVQEVPNHLPPAD